MNDLGSPVDNDGAEGEACVRSPSVFSGYLGNVTANENAFDSDGWFKTGDLAYFKEGKCYLRGRIKVQLFFKNRNSVIDTDGVEH